MPMAVNGFDVAPSHATNSIWRPMASLPLTPYTCQNLHTLNPRPRCRTFKLFCRPSSSAVVHTLPPLSGDLDRYLRCSMPQNPLLRVVVLVNGGVISRVALQMLHTASHSCTTFYLKIWFQEDFENFWSECPWEDDLKYTRDVSLFQTHENLEHLAMMERVLGPIPEHMIHSKRAEKYFKRGSHLKWPEGGVSRERISAVKKLGHLKDIVSRNVDSSRSSLTDLLHGLLTYDPTKRLTACQALDHPFFRNPT
ncbi:hypothetical protein JHK82_052666 [Glycine max]|nr:hypothetical protein JHK86_052509 [Glycine max]KAG4912080.1 hypothetical protein JHK86_052513 [Glycine max]KAG4926873.1 hypothetical protein JHK85_053359 [Glycine max]KAG5082512.1 hypothetical protein JHK84_052550 [Glycine max]KAG5085266.1 hypothetical protein JHK82_052663 [Glycine max]